MIREADSIPKTRRIFGIGAIILAVPVVLWIAAATYVAETMRYPAFLEQGSGQDVFGARAPLKSNRPYAEMRSALGVEPEDFHADVPSGDGGWPIAASGVPSGVIPGWFIRGTRREAVLILPAAGGNQEQLIAHLRILHDAGYATVALASPSNPHLGTDWGWGQRKSALGAALKLRKMGYSKIAALGISEGAVAAILAQAETPVFKAIVADSPYANLSAMLRRNPAIAGLNPAFVHTVMWIGRRWYGLPVAEITPEEAARHLHDLPMLIIQNGGDQITPVADGDALRRAAGPRAQLWIAPSTGHGDAIYEAPDAYRSRVTDFLKQSFKN